MAAPASAHDPLFHFETHFPERLSRLHLNPELPSHVGSASRRNRRTRASRQGGRYKTQPVTYDEIQEVDEENIKEEDKTDGNLKGQFQAFSRSMDGLVPKPSGSRVRKGSIPECPDLERISEVTIIIPESLPKDQNAPELRLETKEDRKEESKENKENEPFENTEPSVTSLPPSGPHVQSRRPRMTAKAKRRQMSADGPGGGGEAGKDT